MDKCCKSIGRNNNMFLRIAIDSRSLLLDAEIERFQELWIEISKAFEEPVARISDKGD